MWTASARAKINLHLAVDARRPDGYHALTTVFQTIDLADTLTIAEHDGPFTLRCPGSDAPEDDSNLVTRAARALATELGRAEPTGLLVTLDKQVPTQAGLGGGSADAMAALRLLCGIWQVTPDRDLLARVGGRLGSDVPFFAYGGTALGLGRGDEIASLPALPPMACAIVRPPFGVSTADAYRWVAESRPAGPPPAPAFDPPATPEDWPARVRALPERLRAGRRGAASGDRRGGRRAPCRGRPPGDDVGQRISGLRAVRGRRSRFACHGAFGRPPRLARLAHRDGWRVSRRK